MALGSFGIVNILLYLFPVSVFSGDRIILPGFFLLCSGHVWLVFAFGFLLILPFRCVFVDR